MSTAVEDALPSAGEAAAEAIPYATPSADRPPSRTGAGFALICGGLGLIVMGGCFLIGVLILTQSPGAAGGSAPSTTLMFVLYILAGLCFVSAALLIMRGARGLLRILGE